MKIDEYIESLPVKTKLSEVKLKILRRLWGEEQDCFPKPWVSSAELLNITGQKYFDRRTRELRDQIGCDLETAYQESFTGHAWRINSPNLAVPQDREYLTQSQKIKLFELANYCCSTCGVRVDAGVRGLQADHKVPISRGGSSSLDNWQPMCNNCNVGKRRACEGCTIECESCSWAFPEVVGVKTMLAISEKTLRRIDTYSLISGQTRDEVMEKAAEYFLDEKGS
jgi:5-methylcytosine-specific restriction endonuclease McrA